MAAADSDVVVVFFHCNNNAVLQLTRRCGEVVGWIGKNLATLWPSEPGLGADHSAVRRSGCAFRHKIIAFCLGKSPEPS